MPDRDITEKHLKAYNDVFADIVNVLLLDGQRLSSLPSSSSSSSKAKPGGFAFDVSGRHSIQGLAALESWPSAYRSA